MLSSGSSSVLEVKVLPSMGPTARLIVFSSSHDELIASHVDFAVASQLPLKVLTTFNTKSAVPAGNVTVQTKTSPHSLVGLVAVDRSVTLLGGISQFQPAHFLQAQAAGRPTLDPVGEVEWTWQWKNAIGSRTLFSASKTVVLSNLQLSDDHGTPDSRIMNKFAGGGPMFMNAMVLEDGIPESADMFAPAALPPVADKLAAPEKPRVRSSFPETWTWLDLTTPESGELSFDLRVPDSITTWSLYSFAVSKDHGLGISPVAELGVLKPFFVSLDLPYSATLGEVVPVNLALYNYDPQPIDIDLTLVTQDAEFEVATEADGARAHTSAGFSAGRPSRYRVEPGRVSAVTIFIRPKVLGQITLQVEALSRGHSDAIRRELLIEPPGVRERVMSNLVVNHRSRQVTDARVDLALPPTTFPGSGRGVLTVSGDFMGPTLAGLDSLLQMPSGCGEQNMMNFAPDVFVSKYLKLTRQAKPKIEKMAHNMMLVGYQRELTYIHQDGSFSAFGESDGQGSMWLTGFVLKTFAQARELIHIDPRVLKDATAWIKKHMTPEGRFPQVGQVIHTSDLMGGSKGDVANSAFIVVALLEAGETPQSLEIPLRYLESQAPHHVESDLYTTAMTAYALALAKRPSAAAVLSALQERVRTSADGTTAHWSTSPPSSPKLSGRPCLYCAGAVTNLDIEASAYALLALVQQGDTPFASKVAKWLMQQRTSNGGFLSTQDTCVGLQALTAFAEKAYAAGDQDLKVTLLVRPGSTSEQEFSRVLRITKDNQDLLQQVELPVGGVDGEAAGELEILVEGQGTAVLQTELSYNLRPASTPEDDTPKGPFDIQVKMRKLSGGGYEAESCLRVLTPTSPGMTLLEVGLPTGFTASQADLEALATSRYPELKRVEIADRRVVLYLNGLPMDSWSCLAFPVARVAEVGELQPTISTVFAYYSPHLRATHLAPPPQL